MGYTGKADDSVIYFSPKLGRYIIRRRPKYVEQEQNLSFSRIQKRIFALKPSEAYKQDMKQYLQIYNAQMKKIDRPIRAWNLLYSKLMWNMHWVCGVDLESITRDQLQDLPCCNVKSAVEAGLIPRIRAFEQFTAFI